MLNSPKRQTEADMQDTIVAHLNIAVLVFDEDLKLRFINPAAENLLEISGNRAIGLEVPHFLEDSDSLLTILEEALTTGQNYTGRKVKLTLTSGHSITCDYAISPMGQDDCLVLELSALDRYLRIDRDESINAQQDITRQLIRGLAHEIKNPLGGIRGSAQLLARELNSEELTPYTDIIIDETDRLTALVDRLLGPNSVPKPRLCNIHEILERVRTLIELEADPPIEIHRDFDPSIPDLVIDPELMVQVFLNIARNAMQSLATTSEPYLGFITRVERQYTIGVRLHKLVVKIDVVDNGPGVPEAISENLFFPMITGRSEGTGLGLSVAQAIVHQHEGLLECESRPGKTIFTTIIPLEEPTS